MSIQKDISELAMVSGKTLENGVEALRDLDPETKRRRTFGALREITLRGSQVRPLVMAFEDLHWVDKSTEELLRFLLKSVPGGRVLLIFTYRSEYIPTWSSKSCRNQVTLNRVTRQESLTMVNYLLGTDDIDEDLEDLILEKTEGVPFFIEEFIRSLKDLKVIHRKEIKM